ncbi:MAG TPA: homoserine O-succinyltransferase [Longimicrobiales bacterium]|nr:homoserine O-succinyltransferase [Longimicrobiales bacterium]
MLLERARALKGTTSIPCLRLHHGGELRDVRIAYTLTGEADSPVVVALGGISAGRDVSTWWRDFVGAGRAIDTREFSLLGIDFLGGSGATTGPHDALFPSISTYDQARVIAAVLNDLGVYQVHAFVGSSYGGMVALAFGELFPERAQRLVVISAAHEPHPMATALRSLQRRTIRLGIATGSTNEAISIARGIAMTTYRTSTEFAQRFDRKSVVDYIEHCGETYARNFSPYGFLCLSESIDLHAVEPQNITVRTTIVSIDSDTLVPRWQLQQLAAGLPDSHLVEIDSLYGHDAFLKEVDAVSQIVREALQTGVTQ